MDALTLADEIVVLMLDDHSGQILPVCLPVADTAIAGAVLMELSLRRRVDTDLNALFVVDAAPTGDALLDLFLAEIAAEPTPRPSSWWIEQLPLHHPHMIDLVRPRLVAAGILREEHRRYLWVFAGRAYPPVSGRENREAKARLRAILFDNEIPDPRDTMLLVLARATGILRHILPPEDHARAAPRIADLAALEEVGRAVAHVASELRDAVAIIKTGANYP